MRKSFSLLLTLVAVFSFYSFSNLAHAASILNINGVVSCRDCVKGKDIPVKGADDASFYTSFLETPTYAFIREDLGSSCPAGSWGYIYKSGNKPKVKNIETGCKDITDARVHDRDDGGADLMLSFYDGTNKTIHVKG